MNTKTQQKKTQPNTTQQIRNLINKIYNAPYITNEILDEMEKDIKQIKPKQKTEENKFERELKVLIKGAREQKNKIVRNNFRFLFLSNLENEYKKINIKQKN